MRLLIIILSLVISISSFGQKDKTTFLSFDGLYETKCKIGDSKSYLRFYPDRKVISVGTQCGTADQLKDWFHLNEELVGSGTYKLKGNKILFSTKSISGTVKCSGQITADNVLKIKWKSLINGKKKGREEYKFVTVTGLK